MPIAARNSTRPVLTKGVRQSRANTLRFSDGSDGGAHPSQIEVQYNPDIIQGLLQDLSLQVDAKCALIDKDIEFMATSVQQAFHLELIKLPTQVKKMSLARFREEFGDSLEAVTRGAIRSTTKTTKKGTSTMNSKVGRRENVPSTGGKQSVASSKTSSTSSSSRDHVFSTATKSATSRSRVFQTPSQAGRSVAQTPGTAVRMPREGETVLSENGSPLGLYPPTVVKGSNPEGVCLAPPETTGAGAGAATVTNSNNHHHSLTLKSGEAIDLENVDVSALPDEAKADALLQMQAMMQSMQTMMSKLSGTLAQASAERKPSS